MRRISLAALFAIILSVPAKAQYYVTYISTSGTDQSNVTACSNASSPCRNFPAAYAVTATNGTIVCLDSGLYGVGQTSLVIDKSINIDCSKADTGAVIAQRTESGVVSPFVINIPNGAAGDPLRRVRIRGLSLQGAVQIGGQTVRAQRGIEILSASEVYIDNVSITDNSQQGIYDHRTGGGTRLFVKDSVISGNGGPAIVAASQVTGVTVLDNVSLLNNSYGIAAAVGNNVAIKNSTISGNTVAGISTDGGSQINVSNSVLSHNTAHVNNYGTMRLKDNDLEFSNVALQGNAPISMGANRFSGNGSLGAVPSPASGAPPDVFN